MSILSSLFSGISGLNAHGNAISVIGNNISNVNTVGFKASRATFADTLSQALSGGGIRVGRGVQLSSVNPIFEQGSFETTSSPTDMAIDGGGYFVAKNSDGTFYTRAGQFSLDKSGKLATPDGLVAQGFLFDSAGTEAGTTSDIVLSSKTSAPKTTSKVTITALLDAGASITTFNATTPATTSNFSSTITAYDSLGKAHTVNLYFSKTSATAWGWHALVDGGEITGGTAGTNVEAGTGTLTFTTAGALSAETTSLSDFDFKDAAQNQVLTFDYGTSVTEGGSGLTGTTQFSGTSSIITQQQDGYGVGTLSSLETNQEGIISGRYSNG
ncbi:MAG: flagellar hook-basal body complex protein, partial [Deltaproteobacteria bacterium]|nr:flagellar hook-basal body complex protein [Deltaproteobacteria bacterium]